MSKVAIQAVMNELETLPESDQELVLGFLQSLKRQRRSGPAPPARHGRNPALSVIDGLLIFTGELEDNQTDWIKVVREERDDTFIRQALRHGDERE